jgi:hypothetical protein
LFAKTDRYATVFFTNVTDTTEAHKLLQMLPLGQAKMMTFELIPIGPLWPLGLLLAEPAKHGDVLAAVLSGRRVLDGRLLAALDNLLGPHSHQTRCDSSFGCLSSTDFERWYQMTAVVLRMAARDLKDCNAVLQTLDASTMIGWATLSPIG